MGPAGPDTVVLGDVVLVARPGGLERAEAIGVRNGRVVAAGERRAVLDTAVPGARIIDAVGQAVLPGLHDAHLHLVDLARSRREIDFGTAAAFDEVVERAVAGARAVPADAWVVGRGWSASSLDAGRLDLLEEAVRDRPAFFISRDGHSAWASRTSLLRAGISAHTADPPGGRMERRSDGTPNGILRENAVDLLRPLAVRLSGADLRPALDETISTLAGWGITAVTDAGDFTADNGVGAYASLGSSFSELAEASSAVDGRLRVTANIPAPALAAAVELGMTTGAVVGRSGAVRAGWLKVFADGVLGSRTAAMFEPYSCPAGGDGRGILTISAEELRSVIGAARAAGIGVAVHAIGDRANAEVLDAFGATPRGAGSRQRERIEHAQHTRPEDRSRMAQLGLVASVQPIHCLSDREQVERCCAGRTERAYAFHSLAAAGVTLAFGSDAPVEDANPWAGMYAAVHRRAADETAAWHPGERIGFAAALSAYTVGSAVAAGREDEGHLQVGARADMAVLDRGLEELLAVDSSLTNARAELTLLGGREVR